MDQDYLPLKTLFEESLTNSSNSFHNLGMYLLGYLVHKEMVDTPPKQEATPITPITTIEARDIFNAFANLQFSGPGNPRMTIPFLSVKGQVYGDIIAADSEAIGEAMYHTVRNQDNERIFPLFQALNQEYNPIWQSQDPDVNEATKVATKAGMNSNGYHNALAGSVEDETKTQSEIFSAVVSVQSNKYYNTSLLSNVTGLTVDFAKKCLSLIHI